MSHPVIRAFEAVFNLSGGVERITALTVTCHHCAETTSASEDTLLPVSYTHLTLPTKA